MTKLIRFDWAMKHLLRNKANFDVLEGFLSVLLNDSIKIDSILESEGNKESADDKFNRVDLLVKTEKDERIIVEVQCNYEWDYFSRILYGTSKAVTEHMIEGAPYGDIRKIISVSIVFFNLGEGEDYLYKGSTTFVGIHRNDILKLAPSEQKMYNQGLAQNRLKTPDAIFPEYYIIKVSKFHERVNNKLDEWIYFLKSGKIKQSFEAQGIQSAAKKLDILQLDEKQRRAYERYKESLHDEASFAAEQKVIRAEERAKGEAIGRVEGEAIGIAKGIAKGIATGEAKGRNETILQIINNMIKQGYSLEAISNVMGLSMIEIKALLSQNEEIFES